MSDSGRPLKRGEKVLCTCSSCRLRKTRHPISDETIDGQFVNKKKFDADRLADQMKELKLTEDTLVSATVTSNELCKDTVTTSRSRQPQGHGPSTSANVQGDGAKSGAESDHQKGEPVAAMAMQRLKRFVWLRQTTKHPSSDYAQCMKKSNDA
jgi:hypothetical protein